MSVENLARLSLMNEEDAALILRRINGSVAWSAEMIIELSLHGFSPSEIYDKLNYDPLYLLAYLAIKGKAL